MKPSKIIITLELNCAADISEEHFNNLASNSLSWVSHRVALGERFGNLHHTSGSAYGSFTVSKLDEMKSYDPSN